jgi:glycosyltransferase involved in cell wall biosynthesis
MGDVVRTVQVVVPEGIDDPARPSGGNRYDRRVCTELAATGWSVREHAVAGAWPNPGPADLDALGAVLAGMPDDAVALVDGLVASAAPDVIRGCAARLRVVVLVHLPLGAVARSRRQSEAAMLACVAAVVTTSAWTRSWLVEHYGLDPDRVHVAVPGTDPAGLVAGTPSGGAFLCVGAVTPIKGHDVLVDALADAGPRPWTCHCVGSLEVDPTFVGRLRTQVGCAGLADRVVLTGPLTGADLGAAFHEADVLVLASRAETYGMVVTEALARGLPVIATRTGGTSEALGAAPDGAVPGLLVPPEDPPALAAALRAWLEDPGLRARTRRAARDRRPTLPGWPDTAAAISAALAGR